MSIFGKIAGAALNFGNPAGIAGTIAGAKAGDAITGADKVAGAAPAAVSTPTKVKEAERNAIDRRIEELNRGDSIKDMRDGFLNKKPVMRS